MVDLGSDNHARPVRTAAGVSHRAGAMDQTAKPLHIGIVACSAEGAALCYRTICAEGAKLLGPHAHPEVSMHTPSLADYMRCIDRDDWQGVAGLMLASANKLAAIGADFLICPDNTIHQALPPSSRGRRCRGCTSPMWSRRRPSRAGSGGSA